MVDNPSNAVVMGLMAPGVTTLTIMHLLSYVVSSFWMQYGIALFAMHYLWGAIWWSLFANTTFANAMNMMRGSFFLILILIATNIAILLVGHHSGAALSGPIWNPVDLKQWNEAGLAELFDFFHEESKSRYLLIAVGASITGWLETFIILNFESEASVYEAAIERSKERDQEKERES